MSKLRIQKRDKKVPEGYDNISAVDSPKSSIVIDKKPKSIKKKVIIISLSVILAAIIVVAVYFLPSLIDPMGQFKPIVDQISPTPSDTSSTSGVATPDATQTPDPLISQGDFSIIKNTVNILLIGVDYAPERETDEWIKKGGKNTYHSDVMLVLSINRETNQVSLISLPRDTYAQISADPKGIYKLNASLNCGGKWPSPEACEEVCKAASWMIGGLPVNYYYAVDMTAVVGLVDAIGGVDFNLDIGFAMAEHTANPRIYKPGLQHMSGQAVLDYLRVRKEADIDDPSGETGDLNRINRQKDMMVAIFDKLKDSGLVSQIPTIIANFDSNHLVTNLSLAQTMALAAFSRGINGADLKLYSMDGKYNYSYGASLLFNLNFVLTDHNNRKNIIQDVYGVDIDKDKVTIQHKFGVTVPSYKDYTIQSAMALWEKMQIEVYTKQATVVLDNVKATLDADALLPVYIPPTPPPEPSAETSVEPSALPSETVLSELPIPDGYRKYLADGTEWTLYNQCQAEYEQLTNWDTTLSPTLSTLKTQIRDYNTLLTSFQNDVVKLGGMFSISFVKNFWAVIYNPYYGEINQSYVNNIISVDPR